MADRPDDCEVMLPHLIDLLGCQDVSLIMMAGTLASLIAALTIIVFFIDRPKEPKADFPPRDVW